MSVPRTLLVLSVIAAIGAPVLRAQAAFVHLVRGDTILIERFTRTAERLDVDMLQKGVGRQVFTSRITDGRLDGMSLVVYPASGPAADTPAGEATLSMTGDTVVVVVKAPAGASQVQRVPSKAGAQPRVSGSFAQYEVLIATARRARTSDATLLLFAVAGGQTREVVLSGLLTDSVVVKSAGSEAWMVTDQNGRIVRGGVPAQGLTATRVSGAAALTLSVSKPDYSAPPGATYTAEDVSVPATAGHTLAGTLTKPVGTSGPFAVAISITGSGPQDRDSNLDMLLPGYRIFRQVADTLGRRGIAMLRLDDRGTGASGGTFAAATSRDFANDIQAAIAYLRTRTDIDSQRIFLVGHSEGGMVAPMVALDEPALAGLVLMAGTARTGREILEFQSRAAIMRNTAMSAAARTTALARVTAVVDSAAARDPWLRFFVAYDPLPVARKVRTPVLLLQGADDQQVIASEATMLERALREGGNTDVTLRVFPALNHLFIRQPGGDPSGYRSLPTNRVSPEVLGMLADWIAAHASTRSR